MVADPERTQDRHEVTVNSILLVSGILELFHMVMDKAFPIPRPVALLLGQQPLKLLAGQAHQPVSQSIGWCLSGRRPRLRWQIVPRPDPSLS